jgi:hypothetical protein
MGRAEEGLERAGQAHLGPVGRPLGQEGEDATAVVVHEHEGGVEPQAHASRERGQVMQQ